jgi:uncharacterized membrane protein HdeD (DUF308 family)
LVRYANKGGIIQTLYRMSQEERSIFWKVIVSVILSKKVYMYIVVFRTVSEIKLFYCTAVVPARHVVIRVAKYTDVDGGIFENVLHYVNSTDFVT